MSDQDDEMMDELDDLFKKSVINKSENALNLEKMLQLCEKHILSNHYTIDLFHMIYDYNEMLREYCMYDKNASSDDYEYDNDQTQNYIELFFHHYNIIN